MIEDLRPTPHTFSLLQKQEGAGPLAAGPTVRKEGKVAVMTLKLEVTNPCEVLLDEVR